MDSWREERYAVSGMKYSRLRLLAVFLIVGVGFFTYSLCISVVPRIVPLKLKELGVSSTLLVFIMATLGQILNMTVCQWVSFKSDRYRSKRWGRRVPFILFTLPMLCASWLILALYSEETALLRKIVEPLSRMSESTLAILVLAIGVVCFKFFYMFVGSIFHYIYNDVIPPQFFTRFMGITRIISAAVAAGFNFFIFEHAITHFREILLGTAIVYALGMGFMCFALKEPRFPEPDEKEKRAGKGVFAIKTFAAESFSHPIYWYEFLSVAASGSIGTASIFVVFYQQSMGLSLADIGRMQGISGIFSTGMAFVIASLGAALIDRWHPVRVSMLLMPFSLLSYLFNCKWIFFTPSANVFWWVSLILAIVSFMPSFRGIAGMPALMSLLPKSRFGQFCSARSLAGSLSGLLFGLLLGGLIDLLKIKFNMGDYAYRFIFVWQAFFFLIVIFANVQVYRWYLRLGGFSGYCAPASWAENGYEKMETSSFVPSDPRLVRIAMYGMDLIFTANVLFSIFWSFYAGIKGAADESKLYMILTLPAALLLWVIYWPIRCKITGALKKHRSDPSVRLVHHGLLMVIVLMRLLFTVAWSVESYLAITPESGGIAAKMNTYEMGVDVIFLLLLCLVIKLECYPVRQEITPAETAENMQ